MPYIMANLTPSPNRRNELDLACGNRKIERQAKLTVAEPG